MANHVCVIICAAGASTRFGGQDKLASLTKRKKQLCDVSGRAAFIRSIEFFADRSDVNQILLAISKDDEEIITVKWAANLQFFNVKTYIGGQERSETVQRGLELVKDNINLVAVHDAVRCCLKPKWIDDCFAEAAKTGAAILAAPVVATIKNTKDNIIQNTVDRTNLFEAQTPQVFKKDILKKAFQNLANLDRTKISDDAQLVEAIGQPVSIVQTDSSNIKITGPSDIAIAEAILKIRQQETKKEGYVGPYGEPQW